jgi:hypothetical protein
MVIRPTPNRWRRVSDDVLERLAHWLASPLHPGTHTMVCPPPKVPHLPPLDDALFAMTKISATSKAAMEASDPRPCGPPLV